MKYRVVGWTDYDSDTVKDYNGEIGFAQINAIIDDIAKHGYIFSGWNHQESWTCVPVLNDGKKRCFSQRGWGGIMAEAHERNGDYDYVGFSFHGMIESDRLVLPTDEFDPETFTPETDLNEHFDVEVKEEIFKFAKENNTFFLDDLGELRYIDKNDTLTLSSGEKKAEFLISQIRRERKENGDCPYPINTEYRLTVKY